MPSRRRWVVACASALVAILIALTILFVHPRRTKDEITPPAKPEAPPDLEKLRSRFMAGADALRRGDGQEAVRQLSSFKFGGRAVEQYRLYFLAQGFEISGDANATRRTLAALWDRSPQLVGWDGIGSRLAGKYINAGDWTRASQIGASIARRSDVAAVAGNARWQVVQSAFASGDLAAVLENARAIVIKSPRAASVGGAIDIIRAVTATPPSAPLKLTAAERLERAVALMRDGDPQHALEELTALDAANPPADLRAPIQLNRGLALNQLRRFEDSNRVLDPLASGSYKFAIPALYTASKNYHALSNSINPIVFKTIVVRQKIGTVKVRVKGKKKLVTKPKYGNVKKIIQLIDVAKKAKKENYERLSIERLKDLLSLPLADEVRIDVLNTLIASAEAKNQDEYEQQLVTQLVRVDPSQEAGLQHFWGKAWIAYSRGDLNTSQALFTFIHDTYRNPNIRRQARYWFARTIERLGKKEEADALYRNLAEAPYTDLYAQNAVARGAPRQEANTNPLNADRPDWRDVAEASMPAELRLASELTALSDYRDARIEIQKNLKRSNQPYADALMAELYNSTGDTLLMMRALRRAYPQIATVEQDTVPPYFLRMYYPLKYGDAIIKYAAKNNLDPYLIMGLIHQESFFNPKARSVVGATGLMQLMPPTAKELARYLHTSANAEDPENNIRLGTFHFRQLVNMFGGAVNLAIASYNAGQGNVLRWRRAAPGKPVDEFLESIPFPETRNYVKRVTMNAATYRRLTK